ncbi:hypothetical protein [Chthonobacter albigriseus]|uniref:hypothetical protein n=1 Tax=Chthonobacter albigriseus TaxID=1683161 RepID=UPI0015EED63B|nr:hypothetical protein [Chthonobacter albigriseus]
MPTELPPRAPKPINPGTEKHPEDASDLELEKFLEDDPDSDIPSPLPDLVPGVIPGVPTIR